MEIMEKKMETTIMGYIGFRLQKAKRSLHMHSGFATCQSFSMA